MSWVISIGVLGVLVLVHEAGHFIVARWAGVKVERFSIGFGPRLWMWRRRGTEYCVSLIPLGGYVKMAGEQRQGKKPLAPDEFLAKPIGVRALIVAAGPFVNYLMSIVTLWLVLVIGYPELLPTVGKVVDNMPAQVAGFQVGDRVLAVNGTSVGTWDEMTQLIHKSPDELIVFDITRAGQPLQIPVKPEAREIVDPFGRRQRVGLIGVSPSGAFESYRVSPLAAVGKTIAKQVEWTSQIGLSLWSLAAGRISPKESLTGPIGILYMTSEAAQMGLGALLYLVSIFSLSLAVFNVFPIPVLDGGHLFFLALEKLRGRPVSMSVQEIASRVSLAILMTMVVLICINDLSRLGLVDKVLGWWRDL